MISISLKVNGHTATVTAENVDKLDEVIAKVVAALQKIPVQYPTPTYSPNTIRDNDWGRFRPMNPLDRYGTSPSYPPGTILCDVTPASQLR